MFHKGTIEHLCSLPCVKNWTFSDVVKKGRPLNRVHSTVKDSVQRVHKPCRLQTANNQMEGLKLVNKNFKNVREKIHVQKCSKKNSCIVSVSPTTNFVSNNRFDVLQHVDSGNSCNSDTDFKCAKKIKFVVKNKTSTKKCNGKRRKNNFHENVDKPNDNTVLDSPMTKQDISKYDLGLSAIANKSEKIKVAKTAHFNQ